MSALRASLLAIGILTSGAVDATEVRDYSLETYLDYGHGEGQNASMQSTVRLTPGFQISFTPHTRLVFEGRIRVDFSDELEPGVADRDTYSPLSRPATISDLGTAEIRDLFVEHTLSNGVLRIGKQQIAWGRLDGIKVTDVLNPQNLREFILEDFGDSRIGLWSAYLDVSMGSWRTELAIIPDNTGHAIPASGAWFELTAPRYRYGAQPGEPVPQVITDRGSFGLADSAWALRLSRQFGDFEIGGMAYSGLDHEPLGRITNQGGNPVVERYYERRDVFGAHAETSIGSFAVRAEISFQPDRLFNTRSPDALSATPLDQISAGIGIDFSGPWNTFINIQHLHDTIRSAPDDLVRPDTDQISTLFVRRSFSYETLSLTGRYYYSHELSDDMFTFAVEYSFGDATKLRLSADVFDGDPAGLFGQFADRDRVVIGLTHSF